MQIQAPRTSHLVRLTHCFVPENNKLVPTTLLINASTGVFVSPQDAFYSANAHALSITTVDLDGRLVVPGFIDVQINGAYGFDFSDGSKSDRDYVTGLQQVNRRLITTGVTSYLPTVTSQKDSVYHKVLPHLGITPRDPYLGASSLGSHVEGPFLNRERNGIHPKSVLQIPENGIGSLKTVYGEYNLDNNVKMITLAPELLPASALTSLPSLLASRNIVLSAGHSTATYSQILNSGISMTTHLFNAMLLPHQREPGIPGAVLADKTKDHYFGIIADGVHVHSANIKWAYQSNASGCCLVTDAMSLLGMPDGEYKWGNGESIVKTGGVLKLKGTRKIAGSCVTLLECLNNFMRYTGMDIAEAVKTVTSTPAKMLGLEGIKGSLKVGADADFCVLQIQPDGSVAIEQVWKFGVKVHDTDLTAKITRGFREGVVELSKL